MLRVSVTTLEAFRRVSETDWGNEEELIASIKGEEIPKSWQAVAGTAWHEIIANSNLTAEDEMVDLYGFQFEDDAIFQAEETIGPGGLWEVKATRTVRIDRQLVTVVGKCDNLRGDFIQDNKAKFSPLDIGDYEKSLQWRFYLWIFDASEFRYNFFLFKEPAEEIAGIPRLCLLKNVMTASFFPYPNLGSDCEIWIHRFIEWAREKNLISYLKSPGGFSSLEDAGLGDPIRFD